MKEIGNSIAQFFAIIMCLIALAVSSAAASHWLSTDVDASTTGATLQTQPLVASGAQ